MKARIKSIAPFCAFFIIIVVQIIRSIYGLNLSDEMQYYGEILDLVKTSKLFTTDLFIQQFVYTLVYPLTKVYYTLFGEYGFIFVHRILLGALITVTMFWCYILLNKVYKNEIASSITVVLLSFAPAYHNVYAISYNTISQLFLIPLVIYWCGSLRLMKAEKARISFGMIFAIFIVGIAHPVLGIMAGLLFFQQDVLTVQKKSEKYKNLGIYSLFAIFSLLYVAYWFGSVSNASKCIEFSKAFGEGRAVFSTIESSIRFISIVSFFGVLVIAAFFKSNRKLNHRGYQLVFEIVTLLTTSVFTYIFITAGYGAWQTYIIYISMVLAVYTIFAVSNISEVTLIRRIIIFLTICGSLMAISSGNGLAQFAGASFVMIPLFLYVLLSDLERCGGFNITKWMIVFLVFLSYIGHFVCHPYFDDRILELKYSVENTPAFKYIKTSKRVKVMCESFSSSYKETLKNKKVMVVGEDPWIYFVTGCTPESCMLFFHYYCDDKGHLLRAKAMMSKDPDIIVYSRSAPESIDNSIKKLLLRGYREMPMSADFKEALHNNAELHNLKSLRVYSKLNKYPSTL